VEQILSPAILFTKWLLFKSNGVNILPMRQRAEAKKAWKSLPRAETTIFPFRSFPPLLEFFEKCLPKDSHVALIGGGKGHLVHLLANRKRTFVTLDIANVENPAVPLVVADFEQPFPNIRKSAKELSAIAAFSLEYGDITIATNNIADILKPDEVFIFVCHHSDSPLIIEMKFDERLFELINLAFQNIATASREEWLWRCRGFELQIRKLFLEEGSLEFPDFGPIAECDEQTLIRYRTFWRESIPPLSMGLHAILTLRLGYENPNRLGQVLGYFGQSWDALREHVEFAAPLLEKRIRDPQDVIALVDRRFRIFDRIGINAIGEDVGGVVCFALAFKKLG